MLSKAKAQASPARSPVSVMTTTRWRKLGDSLARLASDSSWAMTGSAMKRGRNSFRAVTSSWYNTASASMPSTQRWRRFSSRN